MILEEFKSEMRQAKSVIAYFSLLLLPGAGQKYSVLKYNFEVLIQLMGHALVLILNVLRFLGVHLSTFSIYAVKINLFVNKIKLS